MNRTDHSSSSSSNNLMADITLGVITQKALRIIHKWFNASITHSQLFPPLNLAMVSAHGSTHISKDFLQLRLKRNAVCLI